MTARILVIDDALDAAKLLVTLLSMLGYTAEYVTDPRKAIQAARDFKPGVVLLDIGMPHINGYELAPLLRDMLQPAQIKIIAVTAWGSELDRQHSRAAGFDSHLVKPVSAEMLQSELQKFLRHTGPPTDSGRG
jgi:CheY-like chemotaxis protein